MTFKATTVEPTDAPSEEPTASPTDEPTEEPTTSPTDEPTSSPSKDPSASPTVSPTTSEPTSDPTRPAQICYGDDECRGYKICDMDKFECVDPPTTTEPAGCCHDNSYDASFKSNEKCLKQ